MAKIGIVAGRYCIRDPKIASLVLLSSGLACAHGTPQWGDIDRDIYFDTQRALAEGRERDALKAAALIPGVDQAANLWRAIYRALALDELGRRADAIAAYREAEKIHPHSLARAGTEKRQLLPRHIRSIRDVIDKHGPFAIRTVDLDGEPAVLLIPSGRTPRGGYPLVVRVGHPRKKEKLIAQILEVRRHISPTEHVVIAASAILNPRPEMEVDAPHLLRTVPQRFARWLDGVQQAADVDPERIYLTGFSFDGVWSWILGYDNPERYAAIVALSAVSYPSPIRSGLAAQIRLPVCVLRGAHDHMFPKRLAQEIETGRTLMNLNPKSIFKVLPNVDHSGVWNHADSCYRWMLAQTRARQ
ncbi:MAG: dienelactone hydrolase family protein [Deltaproteobacteria bacterium]|nr:dienelactone hydrolase family protein [Deltaproteobacteria bacterium]